MFNVVGRVIIAGLRRNTTVRQELSPVPSANLAKKVKPPTDHPLINLIET